MCCAVCCVLCVCAVLCCAVCCAESVMCAVRCLLGLCCVSVSALCCVFVLVLCAVCCVLCAVLCCAVLCCAVLCAVSGRVNSCVFVCRLVDKLKGSGQTSQSENGRGGGSEHNGECAAAWLHCRCLSLRLHHANRFVLILLLPFVCSRAQQRGPTVAAFRCVSTMPIALF